MVTQKYNGSLKLHRCSHHSARLSADAAAPSSSTGRQGGAEDSSSSHEPRSPEPLLLVVAGVISGEWPQRQRGSRERRPRCAATRYEDDEVEVAAAAGLGGGGDGGGSRKMLKAICMFAESSLSLPPPVPSTAPSSQVTFSLSLGPKRLGPSPLKPIMGLGLGNNSPTSCLKKQFSYKSRIFHWAKKDGFFYAVAKKKNCKERTICKLPKGNLDFFLRGKGNLDHIGRRRDEWRKPTRR